MGELDLRELGELGLIRVLRRRAGKAGAPWRVAIGDDGAVLRPRSGHELVITTDLLVENVHFRLDTSDARSLGHKTLAVNLSALSAMGARPLGFTLGLALPRSTPPRRLSSFLDGLLSEARSSRCPLVGGDSVEAGSWHLSVTAFGEIPSGRALTRSGARPGDRLVVSGDLGGAAFGLYLLEEGRPRAEAPALVRRQVRPRPPIALGPALVARRWARAAIDLSDGLARDLGHLLRESGVGADVDVDRLPLPRKLPALCAKHGLDPLRLALHGGEDYELLFALGPKAPSIDRLQRTLGVRLSEIGVVRRGRTARYVRRGRPVRIPDAGFEHFASRTRVKGSKPRTEK
jgi:thiamine-monophosphate kinase